MQTPFLDLIERELKAVLRTGNFTVDCEPDTSDFILCHGYAFEPKAGGVRLTKKGWGFLGGMRRSA